MSGSAALITSALLGIGLFTSATAAGAVLCVLLTGRGSSRDMPELWPTVGLALLALIGGLLNVTHLYATPLFLMLWVVPLLALAAHFSQKRAGFGQALHGDLISAAPWLLLLVVFAFIPPAINHNDDTTAYLAFVQKLIALGGTGIEPFSERRMYTFGGQFALTAPFLQLSSLRWLGIFEPGLGLAILGWLFAQAKVDRLRKRIVGSLLAVVFAVASLAGANPMGNTAPVILPAAILAVACWSLEQWRRDTGGEKNPFHWILMVVPALMASSLLFRATPLVFVALIACLIFVLAIMRRQLVWLMVGAAGALLLLAPFSWAMKESSGTLLYPFFGSGVHLPVSGGYASWDINIVFANLLGNSRGLLTFMLQMVALLGFSFVTAVFDRDVRTVVFWLMPTSVALALTAFGVDGVDLHRYAYAFLFAASVPIALAAPVERFIPVWIRPIFRLWAGSVATLVGLILLCVPQIKGRILEAVDKRLANPALESNEFYAECRSAQAALPAGAKVVTANLNCESGMDFTRNKLFFHDQLAAAWPMPLEPVDGYSALGGTLRRYGIEYVIWRADPAASNPPSAQPRGWLHQLHVNAQQFKALTQVATIERKPVWLGRDIVVYRVKDLR